LGGRIDAEDRYLAVTANAIALEDLDRGRLSRAVGAEEAKDSPAATSKSIPLTGLLVAVGLAQPGNRDRRIAHSLDATQNLVGNGGRSTAAELSEGAGRWLPLIPG